MDPTNEDALAILTSAESKGFLQALLRQLQKDYERANIAFPLQGFADAPVPHAEILQRLRESLYYLLMEDFDGYLNLMYAADVREKDFRHIHPTDAVDVAGQVTQLLLEREWLKIRLRFRYDKPEKD
jgi:hypothetical protein